MKKSSRTLRCWWVAMLIVCAGSVSLAAAPETKRTVIVISLDGFPAYALDDPRLPMPTLRRLAREGVVASAMQPINPTLTWPNHTALVTGVNAARHQVLFNGLLLPTRDGTTPTIEPWRDKGQLVHAPTIYDVAYNAGLTTAQVDWVAIYGAKTLTWQFPELPDPNGKIEEELINAGLVTAEQLKTFENGSQAWQDNVWTAAAVDIIEKHKPNLLLVHLLTLDDINHDYGPMTPAAYTAFAFLDGKVKEIVDGVDRAGLAKQTTFIVVSDHGFREYKHKIRPNILLKQNGIIREVAGKSQSDVWVLAQGGTAGVYVSSDQRSELIPELRKMFTNAKGIDAVYGEDRFSEIGYPLPGTSTQAPDLILAASPGYMFSSESKGDYLTQEAGGTHGYLNTDPTMQAIFLAWGAGVRKGVRLDRISNLDVTPTVAALLELQMPDVSGHAIPVEESLPSPPRRPLTH